MIAIGIFLPFGFVVALSTTSWTGLGDLPAPQDLQNYRDILDTPDFGQSLRVTLIYAAATTLFTVFIGFVLASVIRERLRGWRFYKVVWFLPVLLPGTVVGLLFSGAFFTPKVGAIDGATRLVGLTPPHNGWLGTPNLALIAVVITAVWASSGWPMIILLAAMERVSQDYLDAAALDGAGPIARTWYVMLPALRPVFVGVVTLQLIFGLKAFDIIFLMTRGGPINATRVMGVLMYNTAFTGGQFGLGCAIAVLMVLIITPIGLMQQVFLRRGSR
jgi:ABC-type sugar transport system permease subunit